MDKSNKLQNALAVLTFGSIAYLTLFPNGIVRRCNSRSPQFKFQCELARNHRYEHRGNGFQWL